MIPFQEAFGLSVEDMSKMMTSELLDGCVDDPSVKAGFIGEIGCCYPMNGKFYGPDFLTSIARIRQASELHPANIYC
jgi:hypothetical protein